MSWYGVIKGRVGHAIVAAIISNPPFRLARATPIDYLPALTQQWYQASRQPTPLLQPGTQTGGFTGLISLNGNQLVNGLAGAGASFQPRGVNVSGFETGPIQQYCPGGSACAGNEPTISALQSWRNNCVRLPFNEASWMGGCPTTANGSGIAARFTWDSAGVMRIPDPCNNYKAKYVAQVNAIIAGGMYVISDNHWTAPCTISPLGQDCMANTDNSIAAWADMAATFAGNDAWMGEPFNEPYTDGVYDGATLTGPAGTVTSGSTTTLVDTSQTWNANMWVGCVVTNSTTGHTGTITANTHTTLTFGAMASANAAGNAYYFSTLTNVAFQVLMQGGFCNRALQSGPNYVPLQILQLSGYTGIFYPGDTITQGSATGTVSAFDAVNKKIYYAPGSGTFATGTVTRTTQQAKSMTCLSRQGQGGIASGGSATTLVDSSRSWTTNQWAGYTMYDVSSQLTSTIASNTATTLTFSSIGTAVAAQDQYLITKPIFTPSASSSANGPTTYANNGIYGNSFNVWRTATDPTTGSPEYLAFYINNTNVKNVLLVWGNDGTFMYNPNAESPGGDQYYNVPGIYTVDVNPSTSATYPTTGWTNAATVTGNLNSKRAHVVAMLGGGWVRMNFTAGCVYNAASNMDIAFVCDVYDATYGVSDGVAFVGDSITALSMDYSLTNHVTAVYNVDSWHNMANAYGGNYAGSQYFPPFINAGIAYWTAEQYLGPTNSFTFASMLAACPFRYISITLGTNDLPNYNNGTGPGLFQAAMESMVTQAQQASRVVVINTIPWLSDSQHQPGLTTYNNIITGTLYGLPGVVQGVDFFTYFSGYTGTATGGSTTTLVDSSQNWAPNAYQGCVVTNNVSGDTATVLSNTATTLTFSAMATANASGNSYNVNGQGLISSDGIHPNSQGLANMRRLLAYFYANLNISTTATVSNANGTWQIAGNQQMINAIRGAGNTRPLFIGGVGYNNDMSGWLANVAYDSAGQLGASWHPYTPQQGVGTVGIASGGTGYTVGNVITLAQTNAVYTPAQINVTAVSGGVVTGISIANAGDYLQTQVPSPTTAVAQGSVSSGSGTGFTAHLSNWQNIASQGSVSSQSAVEIIDNTYFVFNTESGEYTQITPPLTGSPWLSNLTSLCDANGWGLTVWGWNLFGYNPQSSLSSPVMIENSGGTPTPGQGVLMNSWIFNHL